MIPDALSKSQAGKNIGGPSNITHQRQRLPPTQPQHHSGSAEDPVDVFDIAHIDESIPESASYDESSICNMQPFGRGPNWRDLIVEAFDTSSTDLMGIDELTKSIESRYPIHTTGAGSEDWPRVYVQTVLEEDSTFQRSLTSDSDPRSMWSLTSQSAATSTKMIKDTRYLHVKATSGRPASLNQSKQSRKTMTKWI